MINETTQTSGTADVRGTTDSVHASPYEAPALNFVGEARDVVMGVPGGSYDWPGGFAEPLFEFEDDGD